MRIEARDREPRLGNPEVPLQPAQRRPPARFDQRAASGCRVTSQSGRWVVTGTVRSVGPASIITTLPGETPQRSATNSVWPGMLEADRVELLLGDRAGHHRGGRAGAGEADGDLQRIERAVRAGDARMAGNVGLRRIELDQRQRIIERGVRLARDRRPARSGRPKPRRSSADRRSRRTAADRTRRDCPSIWRSLPGRSRRDRRAKPQAGIGARVPSAAALAKCAISGIRSPRRGAGRADSGGRAMFTRSSLSWL